MIPMAQASALIRQLGGLKEYPKAYGTGEAEVERAAAAEFALIEAAMQAPSVQALEIFIAGWKRRDPEAPKPFHLWDAWRGPAIPKWEQRREVRCERCGDTGSWTRFIVSDALGAGWRAESFEIAPDQVDAWWERIRATPNCAQRVYDFAVRCACGIIPAGLPPKAPAAQERRRGALQQVGRNE